MMEVNHSGLLVAFGAHVHISVSYISYPLFRVLDDTGSLIRTNLQHALLDADVGGHKALVLFLVVTNYWAGVRADRFDFLLGDVDVILVFTLLHPLINQFVLHELITAWESSRLSLDQLLGPLSIDNLLIVTLTMVNRQEPRIIGFLFTSIRPFFILFWLQKVHDVHLVNTRLRSTSWGHLVDAWRIVVVTAVYRRHIEVLIIVTDWDRGLILLLQEVVGLLSFRVSSAVTWWSYLAKIVLAHVVHWTLSLLALNSINFFLG